MAQTQRCSLQKEKSHSPHPHRLVDLMSPLIKLPWNCPHIPCTRMNESYGGFRHRRQSCRAQTRTPGFPFCVLARARPGYAHMYVLPHVKGYTFLPAGRTFSPTEFWRIAGIRSAISYFAYHINAILELHVSLIHRLSSYTGGETRESGPFGTYRDRACSGAIGPV